MNRKKDTAYGIKRIESKNARAAIIQKIASDFNLMPIMAEAYYKQISSYFAEHADVQLTSGQICYEAVGAEEPAGKHIVLARKVSCRLTLNDVETDLEVLATYGLAGLRRHRILRLTKETYDQEVLLAELRGFSSVINQQSFDDETRHSAVEARRVFRHDTRGETRHGPGTLS